MTQYLAPIAFTLFVWWFSTVAIIYAGGLPRHTFRWTMLGTSAVLVGALFGLDYTGNDVSVGGAYAAFTCAVLVWGWQEVGLLLGFITGPRCLPCPPDCHGRRRLVFALQTILYHEYALIVLAIAVFLIVSGGENLVGLWTFAVLWAMRQSAKLNLFLGVRNLGEKLLPEHLRYLETYFARKAINPLFPFSIAASATIALLVWQEALATDASAFEVTGYTLVATLLTLAIVEHLFMILPLPAEALWGWGLRSRATPKRVDSANAESGSKSWSVALPGPCDPQVLRELLEAGARGAFGEVDRIDGITRAESGWIHFEMVRGRSRVASLAPGEHKEPRVFASGRGVDAARLQAAFDACAAPS
jgi:putative photosynthetic complex assembly protein 2